MRNAWISGWLSARALFHWLAPAAYLPSLVISPALHVTFFGLVITYSGRDPMSGVTALILINAAVAGLYGGLMVVSGDRWHGTLEPVVQTGMRAGTRLLGRLVPIIAYASATSLILLIGAALSQIVTFADAGRLLAVALLATAGAASVSALGLLVGTLGLLLRDAFVWGNVLILLLQATSGAFLPRQELPEPVRLATSVLPLGHSVEAAQAIVGSGVYDALLSGIVAELAIAVVLGALSALISRRLEIVAMRTGRLGFT
ncbi:ABC transporter permease [Nonomuraea sp. NPDC049725]|uniref:ABC transporter permease n=1 Tax=Nonomuraea sp. NPDC049725 TaxID=3154508 RepID=UPI00342B6AAD